MNRSNREQVVEGRRTRVYRGGDGIVRIIVTSSAPLELSDGQEVLQALRRIGSEAPEPALADIRALRSVDASVRRLMASSAGAERLSAVALLVGGPVSRVIGNFFVRLNRPPFATRLFDDEAEAAAWIRSLGGPHA